MWNFAKTVNNQSTLDTNPSIAALRQHFENLFPGKWIRADNRQKTLLTGLPEIDHSLTRGLARQRITEWIGAVSSGKTSILRTIVSNWCASGLAVAYIDTENKLVASDWIFIEQGACGTKPANMPDRQRLSGSVGRFWVIRNVSNSNRDALQNSDINRHSNNFAGKRRFRHRLVTQEHLWATNELIRSNAFDVVILDLGSSEQTRPIPSKIYARLQNSLFRSKTALILLRDCDSSKPGWGCHAQIGFRWGPTLKSIEGLQGAVMILPSIYCSVIKDGLSHTSEVQLTSHVTNSLFTHPPVPDRRTPKT